MRRRTSNGSRPGAKDLNPGGDVAAYLVERAVRISWQLDRADFHERARLAKRILKGPGNRKGARECAVEELIRRLLDPDNLGQADTAASARKRSSSRRKPEREISDDPRELIEKLESSAEGCRRLLAEWGRLLESVDGWIGPDDATCDEMVPRKRLLRLFGFREDGTEDPAELDPSLLLILRVQDLAEGEVCRRILRQGRDDEDEEDLDETTARDRSRTRQDPPSRRARAPGPPARFPDPATPPSPELPRLKAEFRTMVAEEYDRLTCRLEELEGGKADDEGHDADRADRAAFDDSPEGDRLHRYQAHWSRSLLRTLDAIHREGKQDEHDDRADGDEDVPVPGSSAADEPEVGRRRVPDAVLEVDPAVNAASESAPQGGEVNSAKQTHGEVPRPLKAEPCGERSKRGESGETPHEGLETQRAKKPIPGGSEPRKGRQSGRWCIGGEREPRKTRRTRKGKGGRRVGCASGRGKVNRVNSGGEWTTNLTNLTNLRNGRIVRNGKLPPGGARSRCGWTAHPIPLPLSIRWIRQIRGSSSSWSPALVVDAEQPTRRPPFQRARETRAAQSRASRSKPARIMWYVKCPPTSRNS